MSKLESSGHRSTGVTGTLIMKECEGLLVSEMIGKVSKGESIHEGSIRSRGWQIGGSVVLEIC